MTRCKRTFLQALIFLLIAGAAMAGASSLAEVQQRGKLIMLCFPHTRSVFARPDLNYGPTKRVGTAEHFIGIDVKLMQAFADSLDVELEIRTLETPGYEHLIPALLEGKADLLASSLTITDARREVVEFSKPYFTVFPVIVTRRGSGIKSAEDLDDRTAVTIPGSSHMERLRALGVPEGKMRFVEFTPGYYFELLEETADFAVLDSITATRDLTDFPDLEVAFRLPEEEHYGIALPPGSDLLPVLDRFLDDLRARGELQRIVERTLAALPSDGMGQSK